MKYKVRPSEVEAIQYTGLNALELIIWSKGIVRQCEDLSTDLIISNDNERLRLRPSDWLICGIGGEFYPCDPRAFEEIYEPC